MHVVHYLQKLLGHAINTIYMEKTRGENYFKKKKRTKVLPKGRNGCMPWPLKAHSLYCSSELHVTS